MPLYPTASRRCPVRRLIGTLIGMAVAAWAAAAEPERAPPLPPSVSVADHTPGDDPLTRVQLTLGRDQPYRFTLAYRGRLLPFRGHVCYAFAGYNETCVDPKIEWLTPATDIELYAPGGVPRDLLEGYVMEVRYPALSPRTYRYPLTARGTKPTGGDEGRVP